MTGSQIPKLNMKAHLLCLLQTCVFCIRVPEASAGASAFQSQSQEAWRWKGKPQTGRHTRPTHTRMEPAKGLMEPLLEKNNVVFNFTSVSVFPARRSPDKRWGSSASNPMVLSQFYGVFKKMT